MLAVAVILPGNTIGDDAIVGVTSVVLGDLPSRARVTGSAASVRATD